MQIPHPTPAEALVADPIGVGRFGSFDAAMRAVLAASDAVETLEEIMLEQPQADCPVIHRFGPSVYIREIRLPAGAFVVGAHHKTEHLNIMLTGRVTVRTDDGRVEDLTAPMIFVGKPGKKIGYVHEDVVWQNVYSTDETDIETLERMFVERPAKPKTKLLGAASIERELDRIDYWRVLNEYGIPHELARAQSENTADMMHFPLGSYKVMVSDSAIEGRGLFATATIEPGELIAPARIGDKRTPAGRYTNHSINPNAHFVLRSNGDLDLVALREIAGMKGGQLGEEITIDYRNALEIRKQLCHQPSQQQ